ASSTCSRCSSRQTIPGRTFLSGNISGPRLTTRCSPCAFSRFSLAAPTRRSRWLPARDDFQPESRDLDFVVEFAPVRALEQQFQRGIDLAEVPAVQPHVSSAILGCREYRSMQRGRRASTRSAGLHVTSASPAPATLAARCCPHPTSGSCLL